MMFWGWRMYVSISYTSTNAIAAPRVGYYHRTNMYFLGCIADRRRASLWWNPPRVLPILGVIAQVYKPNKRVS